MANNTFEKKDVWTIIRLALILLAITAVVAMLLGAVNEITKGPIAEQKAHALAEGMSEVMEAESYELLENMEDRGFDPLVAEVYTAVSAGNTVGYCIKTTPSGYGGVIEMVVGVDLDGAVTGVKITSMSETANVGTKTRDAEWLSQFKGKRNGVSVITRGDAGENEVSAVSGATVSSKAVTNGVAAAIGAAELMKGAA